MNKFFSERGISRRNGIIRMVLVALSVILEVVLLVMLSLNISKAFEWINIATRIIAAFFALWICSKYRTTAMKMPWVFIMLMFPVMGITLFFFIGLNGSTYKMKKRFKKIDEILFTLLPDDKASIEAFEKEDLSIAGISKYIRNNAKYPVYKDVPVRFFSDTVEALNAQVEAMKGAKKFIFMEYFAFQNAKAWKMIEEVLVKKAKEGVDVRVFYDDLGSIGFVNTDFAKDLSKKGINCRIFNPFTFGANLFLNNRDHRKITVIDGEYCFTGGYNIADEYFNFTHPFGNWKDTGIEIWGEAVQSYTDMFLEMWNAIRTDDLDDTDFNMYFSSKEKISFDEKSMQGFSLAKFLQPYADSPLDNEQVGENVYISIIEKAEKYCYFVTPYLIISDEMMHAFSLASKRGVDVRIITPGIPDKKIVYSVTRSFYNGLARNGVRIYEWTPGFVHAKMCVSDDKLATCGTINLDYRSLYHHFENGCLIYGGEVIFDILKDFNKMFYESTEVTLKYSTDRSGFLRLGQLVLRLFSGLL